MVKKITTLSTLILDVVCAASIASLANIATATSPPPTYWTLDELDALAQEVRQNSSCTDDFCLEMELWNLRQTGDKYKALSESMAIPLKITAFNPSKGTITIRYNTENDRLKNLHIARFDVGGPDYDFNEAARDSLPFKPGTHLAVSEKESKNGENWFPLNQNVTFQMLDATFSDNIAPVFWFFFDTPNTDWGWGGQYHFKECLESPDYHEDMECRLAYTKERAMYVPAEAPILNSTSTGQEERTEEPEKTEEEPQPEIAKSNNSPAPTSSTPQQALGTTLDLTPEPSSEPTPEPTLASLPTPVAPLVATTLTSDEIEVPKLGGDTCRKERIVIFPWWLIILILIGNAAILWLFWPKKSKKPIDKSCNL